MPGHITFFLAGEQVLRVHLSQLPSAGVPDMSHHTIFYTRVRDSNSGPHDYTTVYSEAYPGPVFKIFKVNVERAGL